ncbi:DUF4198 domain-containing protein [Caulobacter sp.]|uniref:DUF4198 domain-containing protein n=1 Tax=Caulobacter sp. TaxID=78 RepID=UPI002B4A47F8|nr:DUF4198 domain-containing protein [Caulobacter sp.]HJV40631.1 DUF4198 domain-containing protein [Caulobacter sp.]
MSLKIRLLAAAALGAAIFAPAAAQAARNWVLPSSTTLSGANAWVTVDAASSDELYMPSLRPLRLETIQVLDSDGQPVTPQSPSMGKLRSTFDVQLTKPGTYKIASVSTAVLASWTENGEVKRFRGSGEDFAKQVPVGAADLKTIRTLSRSETFVTRDEPTTGALKPVGQGLELAPVTHPSDVVVGEAASFKFLLDGKPAAGLEVLFMRGGDHWKAKPAEIVVKTGADGGLKVTLPEGGVWWMSATYRTGETGRGPGGPGGPGGQQGPAQALAGDGYAASYTATFEAQLP